MVYNVFRMVLFIGLSVSECDIFASIFYLPGTHHPTIPHISSRWRGAVPSRKTYTSMWPLPTFVSIH